MDGGNRSERKRAGCARESGSGMSGKRPVEDLPDRPDSAETSKRFRSAVDESLTHLVCAITQELPLDPVTAEDGNIYERSAIEEWLTKQQKSPLTNRPMGPKLLPALQVKSMIETMVKSGAISGDKVEAWRLRLKEEREVAAKKEQAESGDGEAAYVLSVWYKTGSHGLRRDMVEAFRWVERAAKAGNADGLRELAGCYLLGRGVAVDRVMGLVLLTDSAAQGSAGACHMLGYAYAKGKFGLQMNVEHARRWYERLRKCQGWERGPPEEREKIDNWLREHAQPHGAAEWVCPV